MEKHLDRAWDLDSIFPGGSESAEFERFLADLSQERML